MPLPSHGSETINQISRGLLSIPKARKVLIEFHYASDVKQRIKILSLWDKTTNSVKTQQNIVKANLWRRY